MSEMAETLLVTSRLEWRQWLEENHKTKKEIWLIYYKKHTGKPCLPYDEAVEDAICFGWIDSIVKRIDDERYRQKFTPRTNTTNWSPLNIRRAKKMIAQGKMTADGLAKIPPEILKREVNPRPGPASRDFPMPKELARLLQTNQKARQHFDSLDPSHQRTYLGWIGTAKKEETREKRAREAIRLLEQNQKLVLK
jgi:uncharacterized protein YdeI (YjbR/CyaY-like superfamily)